SPAAAPPAISTLSLHDALPILTEQYKRCTEIVGVPLIVAPVPQKPIGGHDAQRLTEHTRDAGVHIETAARRKLEPGERRGRRWRSEEHTSELQSRFDLVCRLLL